MGLETRSFEVYGFKIEVYAGGRRVWPPSFKRFIKQELDSGSLKIGDVMKTCNVSQSLVYKWRSDVARANGNLSAANDEPMFSEIVFEETEPQISQVTDEAQIKLRSQNIEVHLPPTYPVKVILVQHTAQTFQIEQAVAINASHRNAQLIHMGKQHHLRPRAEQPRDKDSKSV